VKRAFSAEQYSAFTHLIYNAAGFVRQLDAEEKAGAADVADHFVAPIQGVETRE
jgi:hypothetical protein